MPMFAFGQNFQSTGPLGPGLLAFGLSALLTALITPVVIALAHRLGWIAAPRKDRWHQRPTALMGGIAIYLGTAITWLVTAGAGSVGPWMLPATLIFILGVVDDRRPLRPHVKLVGQIVASAILVMSGTRFEILPPMLSLPLSLLWVIGITNAVNLLDNMDGLSAGVAGIAALTMAIYSMSGGGTGVEMAALGLAGACAGFLIYNFNPAKVFMGDCGSMFIGFSLAALSIHGTYRVAPNLALSLLVPVAVLAIPIFDTTLVSFARTLHGRSISQGGRDHSSHRLVALGLSERATVLVLYGLTALFGALALASQAMSLLSVALVAIVLVTALVVLGLYLGFLRVYKEEARVPSHLRLLSTNFLFKRQILQVLLDIQLIPVAFVGAQLLRFEGGLPAGIREGVVAVLPIIISAKLVGLVLCRAYRGVWRYAGVLDALSAAAGSTLGSVIAAVVIGLASGFKDLSRTALIIDWLLFTVLAVMGRNGYAILRQLFAMIPPKEGPRVVILGAGMEAVALIRKLRDPHCPRRAHIVGILDDDPGKQRRTVHGVEVIGTLSDLASVTRERNVACCLLGVTPESAGGRAILRFCRDRKFAVYPDLDLPPLHGAPETLPTALPRRESVGAQRN